MPSAPFSRDRAAEIRTAMGVLTGFGAPPLWQLLSTVRILWLRVCNDPSMSYDLGEGLLARWPDITAAAGENSPSADGPLIDNASGSSIYFSMVWSKAEDASECKAQLAHDHRLVCFDPQSETLRPGMQQSRNREW